MGLKGKLGLVTGLLAVGATGCASMTEPYNDAPVGTKDDSSADIYSMPDGFSNFSSKCDKNGNRVYVVYHGESPYGAVAVVGQDPTCPK
jgi:hypothetical protein